jgi:hypothetical protein
MNLNLFIILSHLFKTSILENEIIVLLKIYMVELHKAGREATSRSIMRCSWSGKLQRPHIQISSSYLTIIWLSSNCYGDSESNMKPSRQTDKAGREATSRSIMRCSWSGKLQRPHIQISSSYLTIIWLSSNCYGDSESNMNPSK